MKVKFNFENQNKTYEFSFQNQDDFLEKQLNIVSNSIISKDEANFYHLYDSKTNFLVENVKTLESGKIYIMKNTSKLAIDTVDNLIRLIEKVKKKSTKEDLNDIMNLCFFLKNRLNIDSFAEEFISYDGMKVLTETIEITTGNCRSYALNSLSSLIYFKNAIEYIRENSVLINNLYYILENGDPNNPRNNILFHSNSLSTTSISITNNSTNNKDNTTNTPTIIHILQIFITLCTYIQDEGVDMILKSAEQYSEESGTKPFQEIVNFINLSEINVKINSISLLNYLIKFSPVNSKKRAKIGAYLNEADITNVLTKNSDIKNSTFQKELTIFQKATGEIIEGSYYDIELYKARINDLENHCYNLEKKSEFVYLNQKFYSEIIEEFINFQKMAESAVEFGGYFDPSKIFIY